jgi:hypothetical protein
MFKASVGHPEFGFGFIPDPIGHRYTGFHLHAASRLLFTAVPALPEEASVDHFAPPIWLQGRTGSCGGHGTAGAVTTTFAAKGFPLRRPADPRLLYTLARAVDRDGPATPLRDIGTTPNALVRAIAQWGIALEDETASGRRADDPDYTLWLEEHVNDEPKLSELQAANTRPNTGFNAIPYEGTMKRDAICAAIADGYAVMFAVEAGSAAFQSFDGNGVLGFTGSNPDHWVYATAFRTRGGEKQIFMRNSWGRLWTPDGCAWCSEDFIIRGMFYPMVANLGL